MDEVGGIISEIFWSKLSKVLLIISERKNCNGESRKKIERYDYPKIYDRIFKTTLLT